MNPNNTSTSYPTTAREFRDLRNLAKKTKEPADIFNVGACHHYGRGTAVNYECAQRYYSQCLDAGIPEAANNLGLLYLAGQGVRQDTLRALALLKTAAEQGCAAAMNTMSIVFFSGDYPDVAKNEGLAIEWLQKAAKKDFAPAVYNLGVFHATGVGPLGQDIELAAALLMKAHMLGHEFAHETLKDLFGISVKDRRQANEA